MLIDFFFPKFCVGCRKIGVIVCDLCLQSAHPTLADHCLYCHKPTLAGITHPLCTRKYGVDYTCSLFKYSGIVKKIIKQSKYQRSYSWYQDFLKTIKPANFVRLEILIAKYPNIHLQPIPLHPTKEKLRGFNQALLIARFLSKKYQLKISDLIFRNTNTPPQAQIHHKADRLKSIKGCFSSKPVPIPENIALIDDVWTTGATLGEAAKILKKKGSNTIIAFTIAHGQ